MSTGANAGQVRGPIQMTFARSVEPVVVLEHSITRMAVATEAEAEKARRGQSHHGPQVHRSLWPLSRPRVRIGASGEPDRVFVRKTWICFWKAVEQMFEHDRSAARGLMSTRALLVFEHDSALGNAPAHKLFELVKVERAPRRKGRRVPSRTTRSWSNDAALPTGVTLLRKV
jgi:CRISPR-associated protein Csd2